MKVKIYTDGGSRGNPGPSASAAVIQDEQGHVLAEVSKYLGHTTNNQAEYTAIFLGLKKAAELGATHVDLCMDSELAVKQLKGEYRVKNPQIAARFFEVKNLLRQFAHVNIRHVRRELNKHADALVNKCLDAQAS